MTRHRRMITPLLVILAIAASFGAGWRLGWFQSERRYEHAEFLNTFDPDTPASSVDLPRLEKLAVQACRCDKKGNDQDGPCWSDFNKELAKYPKQSGVATACAPISTELTCIGTDEGEKCVVTSYGIAGVCTQDEAAAVETAWNDAYNLAEKRGDKKPEDAANAAFDTIVARIRRGEALASSGSGGGCAG